MDEQSKRRPDARYRPDRCHPVLLADGQEWLIPRPTWWWTPRFEDGKAVEIIKRFGYRSAINALVDALADAHEGAVVVSLVAIIAAELLREVYNLDNAELDQLLAIRPSDPDPFRWVKDVVAIVTFSALTLPTTEAPAHV